MKPDGGPAFPEIETDREEREGEAAYARTYSYGGMTLRDYFAAAALPGCMRVLADEGRLSQALAVESAYAFADAMLAERGK